MRVDEVMTRPVITLTPPMTLKEAARILASAHITGAPVVEAGRLVGVLSESDVVAKETSGYSDEEVPAEAAHLAHEREAVTVGDAMSAPAVFVEPWNSVGLAADRMIVHEIHRLPVVDTDGALVGIVTRTDLVRAFIRSDEAVEADIRDRLLPSVGLSPHALDVSSLDGIVTISGRIESDVAAACLRATVHLVPGVVDVAWAVDSPHLVA